MKQSILKSTAIYLMLFSFLSCKQEPETKISEINSLPEFLQRKGYLAISIEKNNIGHFVIKGKINGKQALFILDTGASATCLDFESAKKLDVSSKPTEGKSAGYGGDAEKIEVANTIIEMGNFKTDSMKTTIIDLTSVNQAYAAEIGGHIDGVIGADILAGRSAIIDYETKALYLRTK